MSSCSNALVICGTDTDVGKTVVSSLVVQGLGATYWKPVQSGLEGGGDSGRLQALLQLPAERLRPEAYRLQTPVSPHWAAELEGITIDPARLALPAVAGALVVETAGGVYEGCRGGADGGQGQGDGIDCVVPAPQVRFQA